MDSTADSRDTAFMQVALAEASAAGDAGDVPVGAVVVIADQIVGRGGNRRERDGDPTAHAEMLAIREAAQAAGGWRLIGATLYVTQEPCPMCAGAILNARIERVVYGCDNPKAGAVKSLYRLLEDPRLNHRADFVSGVQSDAAGALLKGFFSALRRPPEK